MRLRLRLACWIAVATCFLRISWAQDLSPRAYIITPLRSNAITLTYSFYTGSFLFNGVAPITGATGTYSVPIFSYYHSFNFFGRSANITASLPYGVGNFQGTVTGTQVQIYRSGLLGVASRISMNLKGGPAMQVPQFVKWKQKTILGVSLKVITPTGQYDPTKLVNWGVNRWAFKPEFGYSKCWSHWLLDAYLGAWFFTTNPAYYSTPVPEPQTQSPIGSFEGHLSYDVRPRLWFSLDGNYWFGGTATVNNILNPATQQSSSHIGVTASLPISKHQSVKFSYNNAIFSKFGGTYQGISVAWQYSWLGHPR